MNDELDKALEWADIKRVAVENMHDDVQRAHIYHQYPAYKHAPILAAAVRSLRETVKAKDEEIARLQHIVDEKPLTFLRGLEDEAIEKLIQQNDELRSAIRKAAGDLSFLDQALNEGDGSYKP